jgi:hypothetical protein
MAGLFAITGLLILYGGLARRGEEKGAGALGARPRPPARFPQNASG